MDAYKNRKVKVFIDFDGTISKQSSWDYVCAHASPKVYLINIFHGLLYVAGIIEVHEWTKRTVEELNKYIGEKEIRMLAERIDIREGFEEFISYIDYKDYEKAVVSAGFKPIVERVAKKYGIEEVYAPEVRIENGKLIYDPVRKVLGDGKKKLIKKAKEEGYFVVYIADYGYLSKERENIKEADLAIVIGKNGPKKCRIKAKDFYDVLKILRSYGL